jgi:drug/metabolite transporter (DMT)-like permease
MENAVENSEKSGKWKAIAALAIALLTFAFTPLLIRLCEVEISPNATIFSRCFISAAVLISWKLGQNLSKPSTQPIQDKSLETSPQTFLWAIALISFAFGPVMWAWSLTQTSVANSALMHNLTPLFTAIGGWLFLSQSFNRRFIIGTAIAVVGAIALGVNDFQLDTSKIQGDFIALISAVFLAIHLLSAERLRVKFSSTTVLLWGCVAGTLLILPILLVLGDRLFPYSLQGWLSAIALATIGQVFAIGLVIYSLSELSASLVALVLLLDPVLTAIAAWIAFGETLNLWNAIAFGVILFGVYLGISSSSVVQTQSDENLP